MHGIVFAMVTSLMCWQEVQYQGTDEDMSFEYAVYHCEYVSYDSTGEPTTTRPVYDNYIRSDCYKKECEDTLLDSVTYQKELDSLN